MARAAISLVLLIPCVMLAGCSVRLGGSKSLDKTLADLRTENQQLREELAVAQGQIKELVARETDITRITQAMQAQSSPFTPEELALAMPRVVTLAFAGSAGIDRRNPDKPVLVMDVETLDGRQRFTHAVGRLEVTAKQTTPSSQQPIAQITLQPAALREAYRSGMLGTRYALEAPLPPELLKSKGTIRVEASLLLASGETLTAEREFTVGE
jgi:hypothetical protein